MKKTRMPLIGIVATAMFTGIVSSVNVPFASVVYADTKTETTVVDQADASKDKTINEKNVTELTAGSTDKNTKNNNTSNSKATDTSASKKDTEKEKTTDKTTDKNDSDSSEKTDEQKDTDNNSSTKINAKTEKIIEIEGSEVVVPKKGNMWVSLNGYWHFIKNGKLTKGWKLFTKKDGEKTEHWSYFDNETGRLYTGWRWMTSNEGEKTEHWSYFGNNGWLRTGWQEMGKGTNNPDGKSAKHWSYFGPNGWLRTGWVNMGTSANPDGINKQHWSYFGKSGWLQTGWKYFTKNDGEKIEHWSFFGKNGWIRTNQWYTDGNGDHFFDGRGWMLTGSNVIENKLYNEVKKKNVCGILKRNTSVSGWYKYNDKYYYLKKGEVLTSFNGVSQINKKGTWYNIKNGVTNGPVQKTCILAHASGDERGKFWYGQAGDQTKSEVYFKVWFNRPWKYVLRPKDATMREKLVTAMTNAAYNEHIGYDMLQRKSLYMAAGKVGWDLSKVTKDVETDCSALVSTALVFAGLKPKDVLTRDGNLLYTTIMKDRLMATGKFTLLTSKEYLNGPDKLQRGDILVLAPDGHTAVVVQSVSDLKNNK